MTTVRRLATAAMLVPLAVVSALITGTTPANAADGEILSPANGQVIRSSGPVSVSAKTDWYQVSMVLYVEGPSLARQKVGSGGANQTISGSFDPGNAPNGTFTVSLYGEITQKTYKTSTFTLSRPPEAPSGVGAQLKDKSKIVVTWAKGAEPDLQSYEVSTTKTGKVGSVAVDTACSGSTCRAGLAVPDKAAGQKVGVAVRAFRSDGKGGSIGSPSSAVTYVNVAAPAKSKKPGDKSGTHDLPQLPSKKADKHVPTPTITNPVPALPKDPNGNLKLPDVSEEGGQPPPEVAPAKTADPGTTAQSSYSPLGGLNYGVAIALAVVLLLLGAHMGAWMRRRKDGPGPGGGTAVPTPSPRAVSVLGAATNRNPGKASATTTTRRPAVILAVPKASQEPPHGEFGKPSGTEDSAPHSAPNVVQDSAPNSVQDSAPNAVQGSGLSGRPRQPEPDFWAEEEDDALKIGRRRDL